MQADEIYLVLNMDALISIFSILVIFVLLALLIAVVLEFFHAILKEGEEEDERNLKEKEKHELRIEEFLREKDKYPSGILELEKRRLKDERNRELAYLRNEEEWHRKNVGSGKSGYIARMTLISSILSALILIIIYSR